jgi:hypothetical protein
VCKQCIGQLHTSAQGEWRSTLPPGSTRKILGSLRCARRIGSYIQPAVADAGIDQRVCMA